MSIYLRKDFAKLCGIPPRDLSKYIKRGKVLLTGNKVDDSIVENIEFMESRKNLDGNITIQVKEKKFTADDLKKLDRSEHHQQLNTKIKELEAEELGEKIQLLKIKKQSQEGFLIPVDLVKELMAAHFRSITISFQQGADNLLLEISKKKKLTREETAKYRKKLLGIINDAVESGVDNSIKGLDNIIREYSKKRGVGEKR